MKITPPKRYENEPMTRESALDWQKKRVGIITTLDDPKFHEKLTPEIVTNTFYVAEVSKANVLQKIRSVFEGYQTGKINLSQAKEALEDIASGVPSKLISTAKIDQIVTMERAKANAVGRYEEGMAPENLRLYPNWKYITVGDSRVRDNHKELHFKVFSKTDPVWDKIFPPNDFGCRCFVRPSNEPVSKMHVKAGPSKGAFKFNPRHAFKEHVFGSALTPKNRADIVDGIEKVMTNNEMEETSISFSTNNPDPEVLPNQSLNAGVEKDLQKIEEKLRDIPPKRKYKKIPEPVNNALQGVRVDVGVMSPKHSALIGVKQANIVYSDTGGEYFGVFHNWKNHSDVFHDKNLAMEILKDTVGNDNARVGVTLEKVNTSVENVFKITKRVSIYNPYTESLCLLQYVDDHYEIVSFHRVNPSPIAYQDRKTVFPSKSLDGEKKASSDRIAPDSRGSLFNNNTIPQKNKKSRRKR